MSTGSPVCALTVFWALVAVSGGVRPLVAVADYLSFPDRRQRRRPNDAFNHARIAQNLVNARGMTSVSPAAHVRQ